MGNYRKRVEARLGALQRESRTRKKIFFWMVGSALVGAGLYMAPDLIVRSQKSSTDIETLNSAHDALIHVSNYGTDRALERMRRNGDRDYTDKYLLDDAAVIKDVAEDLGRGTGVSKNLALAWAQFLDYIGQYSITGDAILDDDQRQMSCAAEVLVMKTTGKPILVLDDRQERYMGSDLPGPCRRISKRTAHYLVRAFE